MSEAPKPPRPAAAPRSVREGMRSGEDVAAAGVEREVEVEGTTWTVVSEGRAHVRAGGGAPAPLLLAVFRAEGREPREALVVGRRLEDVSEDRLIEAYRASRPYRPDRDPPPFFAGTTQRGARR